MKKILLGFIIFLSSICYAGQLQYSNNDNIVEIQNINSSGKVLCKDGVRFLNNTKEKLLFEVYGITSNNKKEFVVAVVVNRNDTKLVYPDSSLKNYEKFSVYCVNGKAEYEKITSEHNDLYIYIKSAVVTKSIGDDISIYQEIIQCNGFDKATIYDWVLQACVVIFNKSTYTMEFKDKDLGVIKGKSCYTEDSFLSGNIRYNFAYTFEIKDNRLRLTFDELSIGNRYKINEDNYDEMVARFRYVIFVMNENIDKQKNKNDW